MRKKYLVIILITFILCITCCSKSTSNIEKYLNSGTPIDSNAKDFMPILDDLPKYKNIKYKYTYKSRLLFESHSIALIVNYDDETYKSEKDKLSEKYTFLKENIDFNYDKSNDIIPDYEFSINSYTFKIDDTPGFPKYFGMIGTSEEKKSIAYLYFYDMDLDAISEKSNEDSMPNFVKKYFKYNF